MPINTWAILTKLNSHTLLHHQLRLRFIDFDYEIGAYLSFNFFCLFFHQTINAPLMLYNAMPMPIFFLVNLFIVFQFFCFYFYAFNQTMRKYSFFFNRNMALKLLENVTILRQHNVCVYTYYGSSQSPMATLYGSRLV